MTEVTFSLITYQSIFQLAAALNLLFVLFRDISEPGLLFMQREHDKLQSRLSSLYIPNNTPLLPKGDGFVIGSQTEEYARAVSMKIQIQEKLDPISDELASKQKEEYKISGWVAMVTFFFASLALLFLSAEVQNWKFHLPDSLAKCFFVSNAILLISLILYIPIIIPLMKGFRFLRQTFTQKAAKFREIRKDLAALEQYVKSSFPNQGRPLILDR